MSRLLARDALSEKVLCVMADCRTSDATPEIQSCQATHVAVFDGEQFQGLLTLQEISLAKSLQLFADLLPANPTPTIAENMPLEEFTDLLRLSGSDAISVLRDDREFLGAVTLQSLQEAFFRQRFHGLMESASDAMLIVNSSGEILLFNSQLETMFDYSCGELTGQSLEKLIPERYRQDHPRQRQRFFQQHGSKRPMGSQLELYGRRKDGVEFPVDIQINKIDLGEGMVAVATVRDVTEQKKAQANLRQREVELAHVLRLNTMGSMVAGIAHEVNQPLYAISNCALACKITLEKGTSSDVEKLDLERPDLEKALACAGQIIKQAERASAIIQHLVKFTQKPKSHLSSVDLGEVVRESLDLIASDVRSHRVCIKLELADELPLILVDRIQIEQVMVNLVRNACEALGDVPFEQRLVTIGTRRANGNVEVFVRDNGTGAPHGKVDAIFGPFFTTKPAGMGMGLAISRRIIESHGGRLIAEPNQGDGLTLIVNLPLTHV